MYFKRKMTCLDLLQSSRLNRQISISARMSQGSGSNIDTCEGLRRFVRHYRISVRWCMLRVYENISQGAVAGSPIFPHPVSSVESCGQNFNVFRNVRSFYECCDKRLCMMMIDKCKNSSECHMEGFLIGFLYISACGCIFVCIIVWDCRRN